MKTALTKGKVPFTTAKFSPVKNVRYLSWEDAFDVEFEDGLCILEPHATIHKANRIAPTASFEHLEIEDWCRAGFYVHYDNGQVAEVSWAFIRELPPTPAKRRALNKPRKAASAKAAFNWEHPDGLTGGMDGSDRVGTRSS